MTDKQVVFSEARLLLNADDWKKAGELKVGSRVRILLRGEVKELHSSKVENTDEQAQKGEVVASVSSLAINANNEIVELMDDDV